MNSLAAVEDLPSRVEAMRLAAHFVGGVILGTVYFQALHWNAHLFATRGSVNIAISLLIGRFAGLGALLVLASLEGAVPLLAITLGVILGRFLIIRRLKQAMR